MNKFPRFASREQSIKIWNLIRGYDVNVSDSDEVIRVTVSDIFTYLPKDITYNEHRGDLAVTPVDIAYFSVGGSWEHILVHFEDIPIGGDVYDAFIKMLSWLKDNNLIKPYNTK